MTTSSRARQARRFDDELAQLRLLIGDNPAEAIERFDDLANRALAESCDLQAARARYLAAQATAAAGDFPAALARVDGARIEMVAAGDEAGALRSGLGRAHILNEVGRHEEATDECEAILRSLSDGAPAGLSNDERLDLSASAYQNLAVCLELRSRWEAALEAYASAEAGYRHLRDDEGRGEVLSNRSAVLFAVGRIAEAESEYRQAIEVLGDSPLGLIYALGGLAEVKLARGAFTEALELVARAAEVRRQGELPLADSDRLLVTGRVYEALRLHDEALASYTDAAELLDGAGLVVDRARALWGMARALIAAGEPERARPLLQSAIEVFRESGHRQWLAGGVLDVAVIDEQRGSCASALAHAADAAAMAHDGQAAVEVVRAEIAVARLADACGDGESARAALVRARAAADRLDVAPIHALVDGAEGLAALRRGDLDDAEALLERAAAAIEDSAPSTVDVVAGRRAAHGTLDVFDGLIRLRLARLDGVTVPGSVLRSLERARRQRLGSLVRHHDVPLDDRRLADELDSIYAAMLQPAAEAQAADRLRDRARELEVRRSRTRLARLGAGRQVDDDDDDDDLVASVFGETILSWYVLDDEVLAMVVGPFGCEGRRRICRLDVVTDLVERLDAHWQHVRSGLAARHEARLERGCRSALAELHEVLIAPIADLLPTEPAAPLVIAAHGLLHRIPFHALHDGDSYLVERLTISLTPSVADYVRRSRSKATQSTRALVIGAGDATTPGVALEAARVAALLNDVSLHAGAAATSRALLAEAGGAAVVHLAGHAVFRSDNPMFSSIQLHDRWVAAHELLALDLDGAMVTLSACESGRGDGHGEELAGLTRAVLGAGARTLVASLWAADDAATTAVMSDLYCNLRTLGVADGLRLAQLEQMSRTPHPYFWAPFVTIGGR